MKRRISCLWIVLCIFYRTANAQWYPASFGSNNFYCIKYTGPTNLFVGGTAGIYKSTNNGVNYTAVNVPTLAGAKDLIFIDALNGVAVGSAVGNTELVMRTSDGGVSWSTVNSYGSGTWPRELRSVHFPSATIGFAVGTNGRILKSTNGGNNWTDISVFTVSNNLNGVFFTSVNTGYVVGDHIIMTTTNGGATWNTISSGYFLNAVTFTSASIGFVATNIGILKTIDAGATWTLKTTNVPGNFKKIKMINNDSGFACALGGIFKTADAGEFWGLQPSSTNVSFNAIDFTNLNVGTAVGDFGDIYYTSSSGSPVPRNDAAITSVVLPPTNICPGPYPITYKIFNNGMYALSSLRIRWKVNNILQSTYNWTGYLLSDSTSGTITLGNYNFQNGANNIVIWSEWPNLALDDYRGNDTIKGSYNLARLGGIYTIGGVSPDYPTIDAAINALNYNGGPCSDVVFRIRNGSYIVTQNIIQNDTGVIAKSVLFESESGDSTLVIITGSGSGVITLQGVNNTTFRKLTILNTTGYSAISCTGRARKFTVTNCILKAQTASAPPSRGVIELKGTAKNDSVVVSNNLINGSYSGIYIDGTTDTTNYSGCTVNIKSNEIDSQLINGAAIYLAGLNKGTIAGNLIQFSSGITGIYLEMASLGFQLTKNKINVTGLGIGIRLKYCYNKSLNPIIISNNFVSSSNTFYLENSSFVSVYFNTLVNNTPYSNAVVIDFTDTTFPALTFINNIVYARTGSIFNGATYKTTFLSISNNAYYTKSGIFGSGCYYLSQWQNATNSDKNSIAVDPQFVNSDFHIYNNTLNYKLKKGGIPIAPITDDIDGDLRDPAKPDIGADQFKLFSTDIAITGTPFSGVFCSGSNPIKVNVTNFGSDTVRSFNVNWKRNGIVQSTFNWTGILSPDSTINKLSIGNIIPSAKDTIVAWVSLPNNKLDTVTRNDSISFIGISGGLSGVFSIGGVSPDYATFNLAKNDLILKGVCGPVDFKVRAGTYNEKLVIPNIKGTSIDNTITFESENGDSSSVILGYAPSTTEVSVVKFDSAQYLIFKSLTLLNSNIITYGVNTGVTVLLNAAHDIIIKNCVLNVTVSALSNATLFYTQGSIISNIIIQNNLFLNGAVGISFSDNSNPHAPQFGNKIIGNVFKNQTWQYIGATINYDMEVNSNRISTIYTVSSNGYDAVTLELCSNSRVIGNNFFLQNMQNPNALSITGTTTEYQRILVANNFINNLSLKNSCYTDIINNSISATINVNYGRAFYNYFNSHLRIFNNIVSCYSNNISFDFEPVNFQSTQVDSMDNNCIYNYNGNNIVNNYSSFSKWQLTGFDNHSWNVNPQYNSLSDLHIQSANSGFLKKAGAPWPGVTTDIDGEPRDPNSPDIGADEFYFLPKINDAGVVYISNPTPFCNGTKTVSVKIRNYGSDTLRNAVINWKINGVSQIPYLFTGKVNPLSVSNFISIGNYNFSSDTQYFIKCYTSIPNGFADLLANNDTGTIGPVHTRLNGTYTIGGVSPHYSTINLAVSDLLEFGVCGPVTFNIRNGTYNEAFIIPETINGLSGVNTILFKGESSDSSLVIINGTNLAVNYYTVKIDGADNIFFSKLTIGGSGLWLTNLAKNNTFQYCQFTAPVKAEKICSNLKFENNLFLSSINFSGSMGSNFGEMAKGLQFRKNSVRTSSGVLVLYYDSVVNIEKNTIYSAGTNTNSGIRLQGCLDQCIIKENNITGGFYYGIDIEGWSYNLAFQRSLIANNFISKFQNYGIFFNLGYNIDVYFNNINSNVCGSYGIGFWGGTNNINVNYNNIASGCATSSCYLFDTTKTAFSSDNNNFYYPLSTFGKYKNTTYSTLASFQLAKNLDLHSINVNPQFVSDSDLHVNNNSLRYKAQPISGVGFDFDADPRNPYTPDIGADEGAFIPTVNLGKDTILCRPDTLILESKYSFANISYLWSTGAITPTIKVAQSGIYWLRTGNGNGFNVDSINVTMLVPPTLNLGNDTTVCDSILISSNASGPYNFLWSTNDTTTFIKIKSIGTFSLKILYQANCYVTDTINIQLFQSPVFNLGNDTSICLPAALNLVVSNGFNKYMWSTGDTTNLINISSSGLYILKASNGNKCSSTDSININVSAKPKVGFTINNPIQCQNANNFIFNDTSHVGSGTLIRQWNLGTGLIDTSTAINPNKTYLNASNYSIKLVETNNYGCKDSLIKTITVNPKPYVGFNINNSSQCVNNNNFSFSDVSVIGFGTLTRKWNFGNGNSDTSSAINPNKTYSGANMYSIKLVEISNNNCADSLTKTVSVNPLPGVGFTTNSSTQCLTGNKFIFSDTSTIAAGTLTRNWNFGDTSFSSSAIANKSYSSSKSYLVKLVSVSNNNCRDSITKTVTLNPQPGAIAVATGATSFCQGGSVNLNANTGTGLIYQWRNNSNNIPGANNLSYSTSIMGNYRVIVANTFGCADTSNVISVVVNTIPVIGIMSGKLSANMNDTANYLVTPQTGFTYSWSITNGTIQSGQGTNTINIKWITKGTGNVKLLATNSNACSDSSSINVSVMNTGMAKINKNHFSVYPNPAANELIISNQIQNMKGSLLVIHDMLGRKVLEESIPNDTDEYLLSINELKTGAYLLTIIQNEEVSRLKFVKE